MKSSRLEEFTFTIPAGTAENKPVKQSITFDAGTVVKYELRVPDGPAGFVGVRINGFGTQMIPTNTGAWIVANDELLSGEPSNWPNSGKLEWEGYNTGKYEHTIRLRLYIAGNATPEAAGVEAQPVSIPVGEGGQIQSPPPGAPEQPPPTGGEPPTPEQPKEEPAPPAPEAPPPSEGEAAPVPTEPAAPEAAPPIGELGAEPPPGQEGEPSPEEQPPEVVGQSAQPRTAGAKGPGHYKTVRERVKHGPRTGLEPASEHVAGHPELHRGVSVAVNLIRKHWPQLVITSTTTGKHTANSLHYLGEAADLAGGDATYMDKASAWIRAHLAKYLTEGIHDPDLSVHAGKAVASNYWGKETWDEHLNHIHVGVAPPQEVELLRANRPYVTVENKRVFVPETKRKKGKPGKAKAEHGKRKPGERTKTTHGEKRKAPERKHAAPEKRAKPQHHERASQPRREAPKAAPRAAPPPPPPPHHEEAKRRPPEHKHKR